MNVDPLTCPLFLLVDNVSKRIWIRELPGPLRNRVLPIVPGPALQLNSFPQLVVNNQVCIMQNILLAGMQYLQNKCIETNKYGKKFLAAETTAKLGK